MTKKEFESKLVCTGLILMLAAYAGILIYSLGVITRAIVAHS